MHFLHTVYLKQQSRPMSKSAAAIPATRKRRCAATLIDALITAALVILLTLASGQFEVPGPYLNNTLLPRAAGLVVVGYLLLHGFTLWSSSQTLGKKLLGLQIMHNETPARFLRLLIRASALPVLILVPAIGAWLQLLHVLDLILFLLPGGLALHDRLSQTRVTLRP